MKRRSSLPSLPLGRSRRRPARQRDLLDLVRLRVAQILRSQMGVDYYRDKLRRLGGFGSRVEDLERWPVSDAYSGRERVALGLGELLARPLPLESMLLPRLLHHARSQLGCAEVVRLVVAVEAMQEWEHHRGHLNV